MMCRRASLVLIVLVQMTVQFSLKGHSLRPEDGANKVHHTPFSEFLDPNRDIFVIGLTVIDLPPRAYDFEVAPTDVREESPAANPLRAKEKSPKEILQNTMAAPPKDAIEATAIIETELEVDEGATPVVVAEELIGSGDRVAEPTSGGPVIVEYFLTDMDVDRTDKGRLELTRSNDSNVRRRRRDVGFVDSQLHEFAPRRFRPGKMRV